MSHITCYDFDECLAALSNETRERILVLLGDREMSVNELTQHFAVTQPTISHHLAVLRRAHLVSTRRDGRQIFYRAIPGGVAECCREIQARFSPDSGEGEQTRRL